MKKTATRTRPKPVSPAVRPNRKSTQGPLPTALRKQLDEVALALEAGLTGKDLKKFFTLFRSTRLPLLPLEPGQRVGDLAKACCEIVHRLGGFSPAVALAVENHLYITAAFATFPTKNPTLKRRRKEWLGKMKEGKFLVANTNSSVHANKLGNLGVTAYREGKGIRITGSASYMSLASEGDLGVFLTHLDGEGPAIFVTSLRNNPAIEIGPYLFPRMMIDSDTRRITFRDLIVAEDELLWSGSNELMLHLNQFEMSWHQLLISALYLGGAARAIEEARLFLCSVQGHNNRPLAELDGMIVDVGRLVIRYRAAWALVLQTAERLGEVASDDLDIATLEELFELAGTAKYVGTITAEEIVIAARRIIGARSFTGERPQPIERLSQEIPFAVLGPEVSARIERRIGKRALSDAPFIYRPC